MGNQQIYLLVDKEKQINLLRWFKLAPVLNRSVWLFFCFRTRDVENYASSSSPTDCCFEKSQKKLGKVLNINPFSNNWRRNHASASPIYRQPGFIFSIYLIYLNREYQVSSVPVFVFFWKSKLLIGPYLVLVYMELN